MTVGTPTLAAGPGLVLRPLTQDDVDAVIAYATSPGFFDHIDVPARLRKAYTRADAQAFVDEAGGPAHDRPTWAIERDGRVVGSIRVRDAAWRDGSEVGFGLHPDARGQGIATRAVLAVLEWCRREGHAVPWARTHQDNAASAAVLEHAGFRVQGTEGPWVHWAPP